MHSALPSSSSPAAPAAQQAPLLLISLTVFKTSYCDINLKATAALSISLFGHKVSLDNSSCLLLF